MRSKYCPRFRVVKRAPLTVTPVESSEARKRMVSPPERVARGMVMKRVPHHWTGQSCSTR
jgi:hypothetical protein